MKKYLLCIFIIAIALISWGQVSADSLYGKFIYSNFIGGGFAGDESGNCYALPPEAEIEHTLIIDSNLNVTKVVDTSFYMGTSMNFLFECDTIYSGSCILAGDTLIVTYDKKPICPTFYIKLADEPDPPRYEKLETPVIEKYYFRIIDQRFYSMLLKGKDEGIWEEEYERSGVL